MNRKRILALCLALTVCLGTLAGAVSAAGTGAEDVYVLNFSNQSIEGYEDYDAKRLYASDHYGGMKVDEDGDGINEADWNWTNFCVLNMINTTKLGQGGEGAYASIPVYCADAITDGVPGYQYRRLNLEDSGYFSDAVAGRLRAIFLSSFPYIRDMGALEKAVNDWISNSGKALTAVQNLTESEAISATQAAIWHLTNNAEVYAPYRGTGGYFDEADMVDTAIFRQEATENTEGNITALYEYLVDLEPMAPLSAVVSDASFGDAGLKMTKDGDGTYSAAITVNVTAAVDGADDLRLWAVCGEITSEAVAVTNGTNAYQLSLSGLPGNTEAVTLVIHGTQDASDVFLFDPLNGREKSQTMLGYDSSSLPVHGELVIDPSDRVLNLYKTTGDGIPLENIVFEIYAVGSFSDYLNGKLDIGATPTVEDIATYTAKDPIATVVTDKDGVASWNFGAVDGVYLVKELPNAVIEAPVAPFFVAVPGGDSDSLQYAVNVYPKNTVIHEDVDIEKDVIEIDQDSETLDVGKVHTWIIQAGIPRGLADAQKYEITDKLDHRLTYMGNLTVTVSEKSAGAGEDLAVLEAETDYTLSVIKGSATVGEDTYETDCFSVSLTKAGMQKVASTSGTEPEVRVYFDAIINSNAGVTEEIPNRAHIDYTNSVGTEYQADSDEPYVYTGGLKLRKTDASDITRNLAGAVFRLARIATAEEIEVGLSQSFRIGEQDIALVFVSFFDNKDLAGDQVQEVTTGEDGIALFYGLAYGDYYLVETAAPEGYNKLAEPVAVTVSANSHLDDDLTTEETVEGTSVTVKNSAKFTLPTTGGMGTGLFTLGGIAIVTMAVLMVMLPARRKENR